jgi:hypothetical protein
MNYTDASEANKSGFKLENELQRFLNKEEFTYTKEKSGSKMIDFQIETDKGRVYVDCTNQNSGGSVMDKIVQKARKYYRMYRYAEIFIVRGRKPIHSEVLKTLKEDEQVYGYKTTILTLEEICNMLKGRKVRGDLEEFFI